MTCTLSFPCFFPSVSSVKTNLLPVDYVDFLVSVGQPQFLVSAYDVAHAQNGQAERMSELLSKAASEGQVVLLDSGNYEAFWRGDSRWDVVAFHDVARAVPHDLCFCHDNQSPPDDAEAIAADVVEACLRDQDRAQGTVIPILHGTPDVLPEACRVVANALDPQMIAVAERALGEGIRRRSMTVRSIRAALAGTDRYIPLHLLGTGNPVSIIFYALAGADSFDGLEWCQTVVDHGSGGLYHFQHWDLFTDQVPTARDSGLPYIQSVLLHNLSFYGRFMNELAEAIGNGETDQLVRRWLSPEAVAVLDSIGIREE